MKTTILLAAIAACSVSLIGCGNAQGNTPQKPTTNETTNAKVIATNRDKSTPEIVQTKTEQTVSNSAKNRSKDFPEIATVRQIKTENSGCTLMLEDANGDVFAIATSLTICQDQAEFLNKKVRAIYEQGSSGVVVTSLEIVDAPSTAPDSQTLSNGKWTITIGNMNAWSGVNNTGNATYRGCDDRGNCLDLAHGKTSCRDGLCVTGWQNGDYIYAVESAISDRPDTSQTTLIVRKGDTEILRETGFRVVPQ